MAPLQVEHYPISCLLWGLRALAHGTQLQRGV